MCSLPEFLATGQLSEQASPRLQTIVVRGCKLRSELSESWKVTTRRKTRPYLVCFLTWSFGCLDKSRRGALCISSTSLVASLDGKLLLSDMNHFRRNSERINS